MKTLYKIILICVTPLILITCKTPNSVILNKTDTLRTNQFFFTGYYLKDSTNREKRGDTILIEKFRTIRKDSIVYKDSISYKTNDVPVNVPTPYTPAWCWWCLAALAAIIIIAILRFALKIYLRR